MDIQLFNDASFGVTSLTAAINNPPAGQIVPTLVDALFAGSEEGVSSPFLQIDRDNDSLALVPAKERGAPATPTTVGRRDAVTLKTLHLPQTACLGADEILGVRAFGKGELETMQDVVNKRLLKMRRQLDATRVFHRVGAIKGTILDADGSKVLYNLFDEFGFTKQTQDVALSNTATDVNGVLTSAKRKAEDVIADSGMITGWLCLCGRAWWDAFIANSDIKDAYKYYASTQNPNRNDVRTGFSHNDITFKEFYGKVGSVSFVDTDKALLIPLGVQDLFMTRFAPADYMETVNTPGLPYYAKQEPAPMNKGLTLEAQSNPLDICTKPHAIIELTHS